MKTAATVVLTALALGAMLWAADDAAVGAGPTAIRHSPIAIRQSADAVAIPHEKVQPPFSSAESGGSPQVLSYQGRLTDASGVPVPDGLYAIRFRLYAQPTGGTHSWEENQQVTTRDGLFSVLLGSVTPITTGDGGPGTGAYLGMAVEGSEEMTPRLRIAGGYTIPNERPGANDDKGGGMDNDDEWVRSSPADSVLYTIRRLGIARGGCSNVLYGDWKCSMTNLGSSCTTGISGSGGASLGNMAVLGGYGNRVWAPYTSVGGGRNNKAGNDAADTSAIVVGGYGNKANAKFSYIAGGQNNTADGVSASIGGGSSNSASGSYAAIPGGYGDTCAGDYGMAGGQGARVGAAGDLTFAFGENFTTTTPRAVVFYHSGGATRLGVGVQNPTWNAEVAGKGKFTGKLQAAAGFKADTAVADSEWATKGYVNTHGGGGGNDSDWVRVGTDSVLYTAHKLGIARGGASNTLYGNQAFTHVNLGVACTTGTSGQNYTYATVGGGYRNAASGDIATVGGGYSDIASGTCATVGGGHTDTASGNYATVGGGNYNIASGNHATIGGGASNRANQPEATVAGGNTNAALDIRTFIGGGYLNRAYGIHSVVAGGYGDSTGSFGCGVLTGRHNVAGRHYVGDTFATVCGGDGNTADSAYAFVGGGVGNTASGYIATVGGGRYNGAFGSYSGVFAGRTNTAGNAVGDTGAVVAGGGYNRALAMWSSVGGGAHNYAASDYATVGGGANNLASGTYAAVGGGVADTATGYAATVGGGYCNRADSFEATVGGGYTNLACGVCAAVGGGQENWAASRYATVGGGLANTASAACAAVSGGYGNAASDWYATVGGGYYNCATGPYSTAFGANDSANGPLSAVSGGGYNFATGDYSAVGGGYHNVAAGDCSFAVNERSTVPEVYSNSTALNGTTVTTSSQLRCASLVANTKSFQIDDPLSPETKLLNHFSIESPELIVCYRGAATIGSYGRVEARLPDYFDALCRNPMVQLTGVGTSDVYVADKVSGSRFVIGRKPGTEVYWTVTAERKDVSADITRALMPVEQEKTGDLRGRSADDSYLMGTMEQLRNMGLGGRFQFRTADGRAKYEATLRRLQEAEHCAETQTLQAPRSGKASAVPSH